jgi:hypothetical protein
VCEFFPGKASTNPFRKAVLSAYSFPEEQDTGVPYYGITGSKCSRLCAILLLIFEGNIRKIRM